MKLAAAAFVTGGAWACILASAQVPSISTQQRRDANGKTVTETFFAGQIKVLSDISTIENKAFSCIPVVSLKKGDILPAQVSGDQSWDAVVQAQLKIGSRYYDFPRLGVVNKQTIFPADLTIKVAIPSGVVIRSDGYEVKATRFVKAGDSIPVIVVGDAILSADAAKGSTPSLDLKPWLAAFKKMDIKSKDEVAAIEAWRIVRDHVGL